MAASAIMRIVEGLIDFFRREMLLNTPTKDPAKKEGTSCMLYAPRIP